MQHVPYCGSPPVPGSVTWNLDPVLIASLAALWLIATAWSRRAGVPADRRMLFHGGFALLALALVSPLCNLSVALFSARVGQHMLIEFVAAPLLATGLPAFRSERAISRALLGALPFAGALWFWHLPGPYQWTFASTPAYWLMHVTLTLTAVLLWQAILDQRRPEAALLAGGITMAQMTLLGAIYTFAQRAFFTVHFGTTGAWGLSPLEDQQLGGLIMWIPPGVLLAGAAVFSLAVMLREPSREALR